MKLTALSIVYVLAACGGSQRAETPSPSPPAGRVVVAPEARIPTLVPRLRTEGSSCAVTGILVCRDGQIDACHLPGQSTGFHACVTP